MTPLIIYNAYQISISSSNGLASAQSTKYNPKAQDPPSIAPFQPSKSRKMVIVCEYKCESCNFGLTETVMRHMLTANTLLHAPCKHSTFPSKTVNKNPLALQTTSKINCLKSQTNRCSPHLDNQYCNRPPTKITQPHTRVPLRIILDNFNTEVTK